MKKGKIENGKKVWYYPIYSGDERKEAVITGGPYKIGGTVCCNIDIITSVVAIDNLKERNN